MTPKEIAIRCLNPIKQTEIEKMDINEVQNLIAAIRIATDNNLADGDEHISGLYTVAKQRMKDLRKPAKNGKLSVEMRQQIIADMWKPTVSNKELASRF